MIWCKIMHVPKYAQPYTLQNLTSTKFSKNVNKLKQCISDLWCNHSLTYDHYGDPQLNLTCALSPLSGGNPHYFVPDFLFQHIDRAVVIYALPSLADSLEGLVVECLQTRLAQAPFYFPRWGSALF